MQKELDAAGVNASILGINEVGHEVSNADICEGRDLPWLQDVPEVDAWGAWDVIWRDVYIVDEEGHLLEIFNLTEHDLTSDYDELYGIIEDYAR